MGLPSRSIEEKGRDDDEDVDNAGADVVFGGLEERKRLEHKLLWKLDCRMFVMVVIYILNYVRIIPSVIASGL